MSLDQALSPHIHLADTETSQSPESSSLPDPKPVMEAAEIFSMIGFPARAAGRLPLFARYIVGRSASFQGSRHYCLARFGPSYRLRPWLLFDVGELMLIEMLINEGSDEEMLSFRTAQLATGASTTVVGSLLASACVTMLTLESLNDINLTVRALFTISLMLSLMAVYFALIEQRELSLGTNATSLRIWLWNGRTRTDQKDQYATNSPAEAAVPKEQSERAQQACSQHTIKESSLAANIILQAPYELLSIAISVFLGGLIAYLSLAMAANLKLGTGPLPNNAAVLGAFLVCTALTLCVFGQSLGHKDKERARCMSWSDTSPE